MSTNNPVYLRSPGVAEFMKLNGFKLPGRGRTWPVRSDRIHGLRWDDLARQVPHRDHVIALRRRSHGKTVISQPYPSAANAAALFAFCDEHNLRLETPPDVFASFWAPGAAILFAISTDWSAPPIKWLGWQGDGSTMRDDPNRCQTWRDPLIQLFADYVRDNADAPSSDAVFINSIAAAVE